MAVCAASYCSDKRSANNKQKPVPTDDPVRLQKWMKRLGRLTTGVKSEDFAGKRLEVCEKHIHPKYFIQRGQKQTKLSDEAVPMTADEWNAHLAKIREKEERDAEQFMLDTMLIEQDIEDDNNPLPRHSTRTTTATVSAEEVDQTNTVSRASITRLEKEIKALKRERDALNGALGNARAQVYDLKRTVESLQVELQNSVETKKEEWRAFDEATEMQEAVENCLRSNCIKLQCELRNVHENSIPRLSYKFITESDHLTRLWTGFQSIQAYAKFVELVKRELGAHNPGRVSLSFEDAVTLWFVKVRKGLKGEVLQYLFGLGCAQTVSNITHDVNDILDEVFKRPAYDPMSRFNKAFVEKLRLPCFVEYEEYSQTALVIDATEFFINTPSNLDIQRATWSSYKHHNTLKILVGISGMGHVCFVSVVYGGKMSDRVLSELSKEELFGKLWPGSSCMGDKGFHIQNLLPPGVGYNVPPMLQTNGQFTVDQNYITKKIAAVRIHIERANCRAKMFEMLAKEVNITKIPFFCKAVRICFFLTDIISPIVRREF